MNYLIVYLVLSILFTFWLYQAGETLYKLSLSRGQSPVRLNKLLALVFVIVIFAGGVLLSQYILITTPMLMAVMFIIFAPIHFAIMIANYKRVIGQPKNIPGLWASWLLLPPLTVYMVQKDINSQIR